MMTTLYVIKLLIYSCLFEQEAKNANGVTLDIGTEAIRITCIIGRRIERYCQPLRMAGTNFLQALE